MIKFFVLFILLVSSFEGFAEQQTWYFIRHFEKQQGEDPHLSELGKERSQALIAALTNKKVNKIYSTQTNRTLESVALLGKERGLQPQFYDPANLAFFVEQLKLENNVLIVGHSNTTPQLIRLLGGQIADMTEQDYGQLFMLTKYQDRLDLHKREITLK
jgi:broad specificity phosphatase PhoE